MFFACCSGDTTPGSFYTPVTFVGNNGKVWKQFVIKCKTKKKTAEEEEESVADISLGTNQTTWRVLGCCC